MAAEGKIRIVAVGDVGGGASPQLAVLLVVFQRV